MKFDLTKTIEQNEQDIRADERAKIQRALSRLLADLYRATNTVQGLQTPVTAAPPKPATPRRPRKSRLDPGIVEAVYQYLVPRSYCHTGELAAGVRVSRSQCRSALRQLVAQGRATEEGGRYRITLPARDLVEATSHA